MPDPTFKQIRVETNGRFLRNCDIYQRQKFSLICAVSVADPDPESGSFFDPGSGIGFFRIPDPGYQTHIFDSLLTNIIKKLVYLFQKVTMEGQKNSPFLMLLLDPGWIKIRIRDKHPGSATL